MPEEKKPKGGETPPPKDTKKGDKPKGVKTGKQDTIDQDRIEEDYGLSYALFKAFPELEDLLKKAIAEVWTPGKFQVELRQTTWFRKHSDVWRENTALKFSDPATFDERYNTVLAKVQDLAGSVGAHLSDKAMERLSRRALLLGLSDDEIHNKLSNFVRPAPGGGYTGEVATIEQELRSTALQNGVRLQDGQIQKWMQSIVRGDASQQQFVNNIRTMAAQQFPIYGEQIRGGMDLVDVANPYIQSMSSLLEMAPGAITMEDPTIRRALTGARDQKGQTVPTSLADFEDGLRNDKRWMYTKNAKEQALGYAASLSRMWGLA